MPSRNNKRILIVEDDDGIAQLQYSRLMRCGHQVTVSPDAEVALELVDAAGGFDLYLLDYTLPGDINGLGLYSIIKERGFSAPAILVTGFEDPKVIVQAMRSGVRDFLPKDTEYLDDLPATVERVLRQSFLEQQALAAAAVREKQELLEAAFDAARLASFVWDIQRGDFYLTGHLPELVGQSAAEKVVDFDGFLSIIYPPDRVNLQNSIEIAKEMGSAFDYQFRVGMGYTEPRWLQAKGRFQFKQNGEPSRMICVLVDATSRKRTELEQLHSSEKIKALNERLQLGMVETNHRVKNHLQKLVSLLNYQMRNSDGALTKADLQGIVSHIHGLAALHDILALEVKDSGDGLSVDASEVLGRIVSVLGGAHDGRLVYSTFDHCRVTARQASSLSVILNELLANALKHGTGEIHVGLDCQGDEALLTVVSAGAAFPEELNVQDQARTGLSLIRMLCTGDLGGTAIFENTEDQKAKVSITFPLPQHDTDE